MVTKRLFDITVAVIGALCFSPLFLFIAFLIWFEDGGPLFFRQQRMGRGMRPFTIYKFRSMRHGEVTRVGRWIRSTGLDEALQFINVLRGEMSMVGPRPLTAEDIHRLGWSGADVQRFDIAPGITGLSQLYAGKGARVSRFLEGKYAASSSLKMDLKIIVMSFFINLFGKRRVKSLLARYRSWQRLRRRGGEAGQRLFHWAMLLSVLFFLFILWVIMMANSEQQTIFFTLVKSLPYGDKLGHFFLFGLLTLGVNIGTAFRLVVLYRIRVFFGSLLVLLFVTVEEASQHFIPARTMDGMDLMADIAGITLFSLITLYIRKRLKG